MKNLLKGFIIGIGKIIPGVSGAMLAITMGVYDKSIYYINNFKSNKKESVRYLLPLAIGIILSILIFSRIITYTLENYYLPTKLFFIGLIIGGIPSIINKTDKKSHSITVVSFLLFFSLSMLSINNTYLVKDNIQDIIIFFISGIIEAIGTVVPGVSSTALLMIIGTYNNVILSISNVLNINSIIQNIKILIPFIIGTLLGIILTIKLIDYLFKKYNKKVYNFILGVLSSSIVLLIIQSTNKESNILELIVGIILLITGIIISNIFEEN